MASINIINGLHQAPPADADIDGEGGRRPSAADVAINNNNSNNNMVMSRSEINHEIEEDEGEEQLFEIEESASSVPPLHQHQQQLESIREEISDGGCSLFSFDFHAGAGDQYDQILYVAIGKDEESSMDALLWTLNYASSSATTTTTITSTSTLLFLIHVFPETRFLPTALGKLPISQANPEQKEIYMAQERGKRRLYLQKFLDVCSTADQVKVKVDTILIESDMEGKAMLDLIPILNIRKLILGTTKSNLKKMRSRKGSTVVADQILQSAPEFCEVKIICQGKEISQHYSMSDQSPSPRASLVDESPKSLQQDYDPHSNIDQSTHNNASSMESSLSCCFKPKAHS